MADAIINVSDVSKSYRTRSEQRQVLEKVSLSVASGDRVAFVGPNGSGKTTLLRIILGIDLPDSGTATFTATSDNNLVSYVPQDYRNALFPWLSLKGNLALGNVSHVNSHRLVAELDEQALDTYREFSQIFHVVLDLRKYPYELSGGEQQIFLLIRAVIQKPKLLVLDEPLSAVDFGRRRFIQEFLGDWVHRTDTTLLFASHNFEEAVMLSNRIVVVSPDSGAIKTIINVDLPWPRNTTAKDDSRFTAAVNEIISSVL
jgi:ABC-type nitrate/sulfonate/bicarbonate transport system ATPase subunit